jgi:mono/diheme cytochrome c family protein
VKAAVIALISAAVLLIVSQTRAQRPAVDTSKKSALVYEEITKAPEKARAKHNPLENDRDAAAAGKVLFEQHCAECHGQAARGGKKAPSLRVPEIQDATAGAIFWVLTNGVVRRGMPVWSKLPEPQRWQIVSYLKSLGSSAPQETRAIAP